VATRCQRLAPATVPCIGHATANGAFSTAAVEGYGARAAISSSDAHDLEQILAGLPPGWERCAPGLAIESIEWRFAVVRDPALGYRVAYGRGAETRCLNLDVVGRFLRTQLRRYVGHYSRDLTFVHAGVVTDRGRAIVLPGHSFSGKSTLVAALVRAGAEYYSDEYAILDADGLLRPYLEPLVMRDASGRRSTADPVESEAPARGADAVRIGLVALTSYTPDGRWLPRRLAAGDAVLALMEHAVPARERPAETLAALQRALQGAVVLASERGDADETAAALLREASKR
jgi:hypothetical protein